MSVRALVALTVLLFFVAVPIIRAASPAALAVASPAPGTPASPVSPAASPGPEERDPAVLTRRAAAEREAGRLEAAELLARKALALRPRAERADRAGLAETLAVLGVILAVKGDAPRAAQALAKAEALARQARGDRDLFVAGIANRRAAAASLRGDHAAAATSLREVLRIREALLSPGHADLGSTLFDLAEALTQLGKHVEAEPFYRRALTIAEASLPATHPARLLIQRRLAANAVARGAAKEATALLGSVVRTPPGESRQEQAGWADTALAYAEALAHQGSWQEAAKAYRDLLAVQEKALGADNPLLADTLSSLADALRKAGQGAEAAQAEQRANRLQEAPASESR